MGISALTNTELIAIILGTGATNDAFEVADSLLQDHGGLVAIAQLGLAELTEPKGMGLAKAMQLKAAFELGSRRRTELLGQKPPIKTPADAAQILTPAMGELDQEEVHTLLLDIRNRVIGSQMIYRGSINACAIRPADVFREAVRRNAAFMIVAHNHPSGDPNPSADDVKVTEQLETASRLLGVDLLDHIVIAGNRFMSLKERGLAFKSKIS